MLCGAKGLSVRMSFAGYPKEKKPGLVELDRRSKLEFAKNTPIEKISQNSFKSRRTVSGENSFCYEKTVDGKV